MTVAMMVIMMPRTRMDVTREIIAVMMMTTAMATAMMKTIVMTMTMPMMST